MRPKALAGRRALSKAVSRIVVHNTVEIIATNPKMRLSIMQGLGPVERQTVGHTLNKMRAEARRAHKMRRVGVVEDKALIKQVSELLSSEAGLQVSLVVNMVNQIVEFPGRGPEILKALSAVERNITVQILTRIGRNKLDPKDFI